MRPAVLAFVRNRLLSMAEWPSLWAGGQEVSCLDTPERYRDKPALLAALSSSSASCVIPNGPITPEWAKQAVQIASKYVMP